jgi:PPOX class probable F420-dependent enzyme
MAARNIATNTAADRDELVEFLRSRRNGVLVTTSEDGCPQLSPVRYGVDAEGRVLVPTDPERTRAVNARRQPRASLVSLGADPDDDVVQVEGTAEVLDAPDSVEPLVEYHRATAGEDADDDAFRRAVVEHGTSVIRLTVDHWGEITPEWPPPSMVEED